MVKILFVFTSHDQLLGDEKHEHPTGYYLSEAAHPYHEFKQAGYELVAASPKGGAAPLDKSSIEAAKDDDICQDFLKNSEAQSFVKNTKKLSDVDPKGEGFDAIFYPGGHGPCFDLPRASESQALIRNFFESGRPVAAVCHAPVVLVDVKLSDGSYILKGRKATCFTNEEEEAVKMTESIPFLVETRMKERGATFEKVDPWGAKVVVDKNGGTLITGQNPQSAGPLAKELIKILA